ncbi:ribonuclease III [Ectothiorhodospira mobilis]|uniref:ribonuclease III n=1 Tax=Ectothiorhodospira mobilis TaxID=195064 RepID=UPI001EE884E4|nr:ribonuclease III [Ectothiorhodospira mobilis]MCG5534963.1 ribonuclease III [Ectothiorhodospira mobilis]
MSAGRLFDLLPAPVRDSTELRQALTHRSAAPRHNERLEFLGDGVLNFVIAARLYEMRPEAPEGELSRLRAALVNKDSLAAIARGMDMGAVLSLGEGERKSGGHRRDSILADALEAVIGAVYLQEGFEVAQRFVLDLYARRLQDLPSAESLKDPKTRLQEWLQRRGLETPEYRLLEVTGKPHDQHFRSACRIPRRELECVGEGSSRRRAEQAAAQKALETLAADQEEA